MPPILFSCLKTLYLTNFNFTIFSFLLPFSWSICSSEAFCKRRTKKVKYSSFAYYFFSEFPDILHWSLRSENRGWRIEPISRSFYLPWWIHVQCSMSSGKELFSRLLCWPAKAQEHLLPETSKSPADIKHLQCLDWPSESVFLCAIMWIILIGLSSW